MKLTLESELERGTGFLGGVLELDSGKELIKPISSVLSLPAITTLRFSGEDIVESDYVIIYGEPFIIRTKSRQIRKEDENYQTNYDFLKSKGFVE